MTVSRLGMVKTETREIADREHARLRSRYGEPTDWYNQSSTFLIAFVAIAAVLAVLALALH